MRKCTAFIWLKTRFSRSQLLGRILSNDGEPSRSIIIIVKTALFESQLSLEDSARLIYPWLCKPFHVPIFKSLFSLPGCCELDHPVFTSLDFAIVIFLQCKVVSLVSNPQTWWTHRISWLSETLLVFKERIFPELVIKMGTKGERDYERARRIKLTHVRWHLMLSVMNTQFILP
jgi:hypothetical protein